jgi:hypothetical protein
MTIDLEKIISDAWNAADAVAEELEEYPNGRVGGYLCPNKEQYIKSKLLSLNTTIEDDGILFAKWLYDKKIKAVRGKEGLFYQAGCGEDDVHYSLKELHYMFKN